MPTYIPSELLTTDSTPISWEDLVSLCETTDQENPGDEDHPEIGELRELADGRVVSESWDPSVDSFPVVWAVRVGSSAE